MTSFVDGDYRGGEWFEQGDPGKMTSITEAGTRYDIAGHHHEKPVVLVHGLGLNRQMWQWQISALASRYKVITYDLIGHGETSALSKPPSLTTFSEQLRELLDHLDVDRAAIAGFSLGGMIVRRFAMDYPDRLSALGILHSAHARDDVARKAVQERVEQARREGPAATIEAALERWFSATFRLQNTEVMDLIRTWIMANDKQIYPGNYQVLVDGVDELVAPDPPICCPTLVMTGDEDYGNSPGMSRAIAAEIPGAQLVINRGLRHMAMVEAPDTINQQLMAFFDSAWKPHFS